MATTCALCRRSVPDEQIHALFTNEELREPYDTVEALRNADRLADYLAWIRTTDKLDIQVETSEHVRERR